MNNNFYFIENQGCDATTYGLTVLSDEEFPKFKTFIENLNKNSYYGCMPVISVYRANMDDIVEFNYNHKSECWDDDYVDPDNIFHFNNKTYTFADKYFSYYHNWECVIRGRD